VSVSYEARVEGVVDGVVGIMKKEEGEEDEEEEEEEEGRGGGLKLTVVDAVEVYVASDGGTGDPGD